ncbi:MAG: hypothetical protein ACT4P3_20110 [Betaproteobacteria bacterium]
MRILLALLAAALLAACTEEPQLLVPDEPQSFEQGKELRERTLNQGESARMSY